MSGIDDDLLLRRQIKELLELVRLLGDCRTRRRNGQKQESIPVYSILFYKNFCPPLILNKCEEAFSGGFDFELLDHNHVCGVAVTTLKKLHIVIEQGCGTRDMEEVSTDQPEGLDADEKRVPFPSCKVQELLKKNRKTREGGVAAQKDVKSRPLPGGVKKVGGGRGG